MTWQILSILSLVCFAGYEVLSRKISIDSDNPVALSVVYNFVISLLTPLLFFIEPIPKIALTTHSIMLTLLSIAVWALFGRFEYSSHKHVEASLFSIITKVAPVITFILSIIFYKEQVTANKIIGMAVVLSASVYVLFSEEKRKISTKGINFALMTTLLLGIGWTLDKSVAPYYGIALFSAISFLSPTIVNALFPPIGFKALVAELKRVTWKLPVLATFNLMGYASLVKALTLGDASKVTTIASATTPFVVMLSALALNEKSNLTKKLIIGIVTIMGIYLLSK